jgi:L-ascorbate metabolism protein UlaG (beta-lactamase superfamily)
MKLTKLVHSCLLIEDDDRRVLCDPGNYSWDSGLVADEHCSNLDAVVVTHEHSDHLDEQFARKINKLSPDAEWYGPSGIAKALEQWGIACQQTSENDDIKFVESEHAQLAPWFDQQPSHSSYLVLNKVLVGGDCHTLKDGLNAEYFAAAVNGGPWGAVIGFTEMVKNMNNRPKTVIPLHDWHWNDEARAGIYQRLPVVLETCDVSFLALESGVTEKV